MHLRCFDLIHTQKRSNKNFINGRKIQSLDINVTLIYQSMYSSYIVNKKSPVIFWLDWQKYKSFPCLIVYSTAFSQAYNYDTSKILGWMQSRTMDYGRPVRKSPTLHSPKSIPTSKVLSTTEAYFVCHIRFSDFFDLCLHWMSVVRGCNGWKYFSWEHRHTYCGHSLGTKTKFCPLLTTYLLPVDIWEAFLTLK